MNAAKLTYYLCTAAAVMLIGIGLYYLIFEPLKHEIALFVFAGALLNIVLAWQAKNRMKQ
jgi:hypothetical protein